jgi:L-alanine-DL-glutamate epimerase-like enolase superfamily enzyme
MVNRMVATAELSTATGWQRIEARVADIGRNARVVDAAILAFPVHFRYGRTLALWSWHLVVQVSDGGRRGIGVVPGYTGHAVPTLAFAARLRNEDSVVRERAAENRTVGAAVDTALCDLLGWQAAGLSQEPVVLEGMVWFHANLARVSSEAASLAKRGFAAAKVKLTGDLTSDVAVVARVLEHFPAEAVRADANRAYSGADASSRFAERFAAMGCEWLEEPCAQVDAWPLITQRTGVRILGDESLAEPGTLARALDERLLQGVNIKLARVGGPVRGIELAERCMDADIRPFVGCSEDISSGMAAVLHVASATSDKIAEGWGSLRLGVPDWDEALSRFENGTAVTWRPLGDTRLQRPPRTRRHIVLRPGIRAAVVSQGYRTAQALACRALRISSSLSGDHPRSPRHMAA